MLYRYIFVPLWRVWFYGLVLLAIVLLLPFLLISILRESWYPFFYKVARVWASLILFGMGFVPKIDRRAHTKRGESYVFVANHTSMTDIMLMFYTVRRPFVFVGKKELAKIPLFGFFYKRTCILVDRKSTASRKQALYAAQERLKRGLSVCIFPEGGVPKNRSIVLDGFKDGAFRLALAHQIPVAPMVFYDNKKRFSYAFFSGGPGRMRVKTLPFIPTQDKSPTDRKLLKEAAWQAIYAELTQE